jgi:RNA polymerase sigma-70 factor, ECF subfamily
MTAKGVATIEDAVFRESFNSFYERELSAVVGLAYVLSGSSASAEDLAQEAFLAAYRQWDRIIGYDNPGAWVRRVVANGAVSAARKRRTELKVLLRLYRPTFEFMTIPEESLHVWDEVRQLPKRQTQVVVLRYFDRQKIPEIADILGISRNTVKTHLLRAKETLAKRLEQENRP